MNFIFAAGSISLSPFWPVMRGSVDRGVAIPFAPRRSSRFSRLTRTRIARRARLHDRIESPAAPISWSSAPNRLGHADSEHTYSTAPPVILPGARTWAMGADPSRRPTCSSTVTTRQAGQQTADFTT